MPSRAWNFKTGKTDIIHTTISLKLLYPIRFKKEKKKFNTVDWYKMLIYKKTGNLSGKKQS